MGRRFLFGPGSAKDYIFANGFLNFSFIPSGSAATLPVFYSLNFIDYFYVLYCIHCFHG